MRKLFLLSSFFILGISSPVFSADLCTSGWGEANANGTWVELGTQASKPYYGLNGYYIVWEPSQWLVYSAGLTSAGHVGYYNNTQNVATPDLVTSWTVYQSASPAGIFEDCPEETATSTFGDPLATSTPTLGDVTMGLAILIVLLFLFVIAYIWNAISEKKKKPWR